MNLRYVFESELGFWLEQLVNGHVFPQREKEQGFLRLILLLCREDL